MGSSATVPVELVFAVKRKVELIFDEKEVEDDRPISRAENEKWEAEGQVVNPEVPEPSRETSDKWRTFVSSVYNHPNLLVHPDVKCIREIFKMLGAEILFESSNLMVELGLRLNEAPTHYLQPPLNCIAVQSPSKLVFGQIEEIQFVPHLNVAVVQKYSVLENYKLALLDLVTFISNYPEILLYPDYLYLYDFLIRFGVRSDAITFEIYKTQLRRAKSQVPASTLLLKQHDLEVTNDSVDELLSSEEEINSDPSNKVSEFESLSFRTTRSMRRFSKRSNLSGGDSGFGSLDYNENCSSASETDVKHEIKEESDNNTFCQSSKRNRLHLDQNPTSMFKCTVCPKQFATKWSCTHHINICHPKDPTIPQYEKTFRFNCPICSKPFVYGKSCQVHIHKFHLNDTDTIPHSISSKKKCQNKKQSKIKTENESTSIKKSKTISKRSVMKRESTNEPENKSGVKKSKKFKHSKLHYNSKCKKEKRTNIETGNSVSIKRPRKLKKKCSKKNKPKPKRIYQTTGYPTSCSLITRSRRLYERQCLQTNNNKFQAQTVDNAAESMNCSQGTVASFFNPGPGLDEYIVSQNSFLK